ncbi:YceI family protein [Pedobacter fastidiosus]|uniref:YceI family protein n=1 Tax=Pedobacter fastidiosus TaxID=2765361 RepID=A0ABR7KXV3_9SPHI|nr:YceI family protein [Pedobacter fastidiosus]MBC6112947.1 YceI family protein [Pedobacter fastidiosus]
MNTKLSTAYFILIIASFCFGCRGSVTAEKKNNTSASSLSLHFGDEKYVIIDSTESVIRWKGSNTFGSNSHTGYIYISKGELRFENNQLVGGAVEVDMNTIEDKAHKSNNELVDHLKSTDFFDVKKFPFAIIAITKVVSKNAEDKEVTGNLTMKGITKTVTFPVKIEVKDVIIKANGKLVIDRTEWGILYKSEKLFNLADKAISDSIKFQINIVAKK